MGKRKWSLGLQGLHDGRIVEKKGGGEYGKIDWDPWESEGNG